MIVNLVLLQQLTRQLGDQANVTNPVARIRMQSNALRSGALLQNLGAFLLELGRTTMTLRLGQNPVCLRLPVFNLYVLDFCYRADMIRVIFCFFRLMQWLMLDLLSLYPHLVQIR